MTQYTGEASSKAKITGIVDGITTAVTSRLHRNETLKDEAAFRKEIRHIISDVFERSEERLTTPKDLVDQVAAINAIINEHLPSSGVQEPKMVNLVVRNLVQEAETLGKGK